MHLKQRLVGILTSPRQEWAVVAAERTNVAALYRGYIVPLAAIPAACIFVRFSASGLVLAGLRAAILSYLSALAMPILAALVIERLAPRFQSISSTVQSLALVAYSLTPVWIAGLLILVPGLASIGTVLGLIYAIYLFYLGTAPILGTPPDQAIPFMVVCALAMLVLNIVLSFVFARAAGPSFLN
jgi:hypothetical protein